MNLLKRFWPKKQEPSFTYFKLIYRHTTLRSEEPIYRFVLESPAAEAAFGSNDREELFRQLNIILSASSPCSEFELKLMSDLKEGLLEANLGTGFDVEYKKEKEKPWHFKSEHRNLDNLFYSSTVLLCDDTVKGLVRKISDSRLLIASEK